MNKGIKVLYDYQIFEIQRIGGISRYFSELIKFSPEAELSLKYSDNLYVKDNYFKKYEILSNDISYNLFLFSLNFKGKGHIYKYYNKMLQRDNQSISINYLKKSDFNIFHPTYYDTYFLKYLKGKSFVLTVYDMIHELFPQYFHNFHINKITSPNKKELIIKSNAIIAISENTRKDILRFFPELIGKIKVIYLGFPFENTEDNIKKDNYILFTGERSYYKNFDAFVQAIAPLLIKYDFKLVCTGRPFTDEEKILLNNLKISDRTICTFATEDQLRELYSKASAFVFPSLYEGFGIPILEAFASNCPAVLSNTSSMPEVGGDAALYFDPYSIDDMRRQIERVITSTALQNNIIEKGKKRVKQYSWEKCAKETMEVYKTLLR
jgi:glycosyltransferase involved in cell wall biosynthesis